MTTTPDHTDSLVAVLAEVIAGTYAVIYGTKRRTPIANDLAITEALIDGPLNDLSVLVQIPKVRELVKALGACENPQHDWLLDQWEVWLWR